MPNPATTLANLLDSWKIPQRSTTLKVRGGIDDNSLDFWRAQVQAVELLAEVDRSIDTLEAMGHDIDHMRVDLAPLYKSVFGYRPLWRSPSANVSLPAEAAAPPETVRGLRTLGIMIDSFLGHAFNLDASEELLKLLDKATTLVGELDADDRTKFYLFDLVEDARRAVREINLFGAARARAACMAVTTELNGQAVATQEKDPGLAKTIATLVTTLGVAVATAFGAGVGAEASDWVIGKASEIQQIAPPEDSGVADAEIVDETPK